MPAYGTIHVEFDIAKAKEFFALYTFMMPEAVDYAVKAVAKELLKDSRLYVPVLTGALKDSGRVEELPTLDDAVKVVRVIYGNANVLYARVQHEAPYNHPSLGFFGPAKFLEKPLLQNAIFYGRLLAAEYELFLRASMKKG